MDSDTALDDLDVDPVPPPPPEEPALPPQQQPQQQQSLPPQARPGQDAKVTVQYSAPAPFQSPGPRPSAVLASERLAKVKKHLAEWVEDAGYLSYRVNIHKQSPAFYKSQRCVTGAIVNDRPLAPWPDIEDEIRTQYGGGLYSIQILGDSGTVVTAATFNIPAGEYPPRIQGESMPGAAGASNNGHHPNPNDPVLQAQQQLHVKRLEMEQEKMDQDREIRRLEAEARREMIENKKANPNQQADLFTQFMQRQEAERKEERERRDEERKERERERKEEREARERERKEELARREQERKEEREREDRRATQERESRATLLTAISGLIPAIIPLFQKGDDKTLEVAKLQADAQRLVSEAAAKSNERIMEIAFSAKKDDSKQEDRVYALLEKSFSRDRGGMKEMLESVSMLREARDLFDGGDREGPAIDPEAPGWMNLLNYIGSWLRTAPAGQALAARLMGSGAGGGGVPTQAQYDAMAQHIAATSPQLVTAIQQPPAQLAGAAPVLNILPDPNSAPAPVAQPAQVAAPAAPTPPDPEAIQRLREALNEVMRTMVADLNDGVREHSWVQIALATLPKDFLDQFVAGDDTKRRAMLMQHADLGLLAQVETIVMSKLGAMQNLQANMNRLREEHLAPPQV